MLPARRRTPCPSADRASPAPSPRSAAPREDPTPAPRSAGARPRPYVRPVPPADTGLSGPCSPPTASPSAFLPGPAASTRALRSPDTPVPCSARRSPPSTASHLQHKVRCLPFHPRLERAAVRAAVHHAEYHLHVRLQPGPVFAAYVLDHQLHTPRVRRRGSGNGGATPPRPARQRPPATRSARPRACPDTPPRRAHGAPFRRPANPSESAVEREEVTDIAEPAAASALVSQPTTAMAGAAPSLRQCHGDSRQGFGDKSRCRESQT